MNNDKDNNKSDNNLGNYLYEEMTKTIDNKLSKRLNPTDLYTRVFLEYYDEQGILIEETDIVTDTQDEESIYAIIKEDITNNNLPKFTKEVKTVRISTEYSDGVRPKLITI